MANKNTKRRKDAIRDAYGRVKVGGSVDVFDVAQAEKCGHKPRVHRGSKVGASGPDIARRLGHHLNPTHQGPR